MTHDLRICWRCFEDEDLVEMVKSEDGPRGCSFCKKCDAATALFNPIADFIADRIDDNYGSADELPYESAEGGYQGVTYWAGDLVSAHLGLPRDSSNSLYEALVKRLGDKVWTDYDWLSLDEDDLYQFNWDSFCNTIKHERRFFFHDFGADDEDRENISPLQMLRLISTRLVALDLLVEIDEGAIFYRARKATLKAPLKTAAQLGPPPRDKALQANRMNPAGIPMMYVSEKRQTAILETPGQVLSTGKFKSLRKLHILDLSALPEVPGFFSEAHRRERLMLRFLHRFRDEVEKPVARSDGAHIDYLPSQVVAEYLRHTEIDGTKLEGVRYRSAKDCSQKNIVFFAEPENIESAAIQSEWAKPDYWFQLIASRTQRIRRRR